MGAVTKAKDSQDAAGLLVAFAQKYPNSDYRVPALLLAWGAYGSLKSFAPQVRVAEDILLSPNADASAREVGFVTLTGILSPYVHPGDPDLERKLTDLQNWTRCGRSALDAEVKPSNTSQEAFEKKREYPESVFDRTDGYVALLRNENYGAISYLEHANRLNPQDALTNLWLGEAKLLEDSPDDNGGIFYVARWVELAPEVPAAADMLKRFYVIVHGSDKGLDAVRKIAKSNTVPPPGFNVVPPPKKEHHAASTTATVLFAVAVIGLMTYAGARYGDAVGATDSDQENGSVKMMIFGGPGHRTYLGCLSCDESAQDSIFNLYGPNGNRFKDESIWNPYGSFGSATSDYSACDPTASDPPVIVDHDGNAYGRLTVNRNDPRIGAGARVYNWLASAVCNR
ncbi:MAG: hypothetical protein WA734_16530 [Candidatus Acidiferrales bacterium]